MIDKVLVFKTIMALFVPYSLTAPASIHIRNLNTTITEDKSSINNNNFNYSVAADLSSMSLTTEMILNHNNTKNESNVNLENRLMENEQLQLRSSRSKHNLNARKNNNDLYFCCPDDTMESVSFSSIKNKDREENTKPSTPNGRTFSEAEETYMERRPALLLRFFPDGTAVLISKFQLHLHVKPKQIKLVPDDGSEEEAIEINPSFVLNDGKRYEVTYKRLQATPSAKELNEYDLDESEEREIYSNDLNLPDHEFITTATTSIINHNDTFKNNKLLPIHENNLLSNATKSISNITVKNSENKSQTNKTQKILPVVGDSPFFMMTEKEMSSLQKQYDPAVASALKATSPLINNNVSDIEETTTTGSTTDMEETTIITPLNSTIMMTPPSTTRCLSFKNQLALALSTEDNIDNSLLKRQIFPTLDCDNSSFVTNPFANLKKPDTTTTVSSTLPIITRLYPEPTTTASYQRNNIIPYFASQHVHRPANRDIFVVTSLPMLFDTKSTRNQPTTNAPTWREVTVGVVRNHQGQPLKPRNRYNNWTEHLRGLRKKAENKFWNDFITPKPNFRSHSREPLQQNIQHSPSQINRSFWIDLQRQHRISGRRNEDRIGRHMYLTNPPKEYPFQDKHKLEFWRIRNPGADSSRNTNSNSNDAKYASPNDLQRNSHMNIRNVEDRQSSQWIRRNEQQNSRHW